MNNLKIGMLATLLAAFFAFAAVPVCAQDPVKDQEAKKQIEKRLAARLATIRSLKDAGKVGESWKGYLEAVQDTYLSEKIEYEKKKVTVGDFMAAENKDREAVYAIIAREQSTEEETVPVEYVAESSAKDLFRRAKPGDWLLMKSGKWTQKPEKRRSP